MSVPDFAKILEVKRYSKNTIENYAMVVYPAVISITKEINSSENTILMPTPEAKNNTVPRKIEGTNVPQSSITSKKIKTVAVPKTTKAITLYILSQ